MGKYSMALGSYTKAIGDYSVAEGYYTTASGIGSHVEGYDSTASGEYAHAEGRHTTASGIWSHAEGVNSEASGSYTHAEGAGTRATSNAAHAEGMSTTASAYAAHAEGHGSVASGYAAHASNYFTIAEGDYQTAIGQYNIASKGDLFIIGNGSISARSNAFRVAANGSVYNSAGIYTTGADYAEMFEWLDGNPSEEDRRGYFVTLEDSFIRKANDSDQYILGAISATPAIVGDSHGTGWCNMYLRDEFGEIIYEVVDEVPLPKLNPVYDPENPSVPLSERKEWSAVGMLGKLIVRDDGSCEVNGFCAVSSDGVATESASGYFVMERLDTNLIRIIIK
jgi:hypothetical protein